MVKKLFILLGLVFWSFNLQPTHAKSLDKEEVFTFLEEAFEAQVSLVNEYNTYEKIYETLSPYFTDSYIKSFLNIHLQEEEDGLIIYGSDTLDYVVPFFSFNERTKVEWGEEEIKVVEEFKGPYDGGYVWDDHEEGLIISVKEGLRISTYINTLYQIEREK